MNLLLDEGSFREYDKLKTHRCDEFGMENEKYFGDGVVTGHGLIHGRTVRIPSDILRNILCTSDATNLMRCK